MTMTAGRDARAAGREDGAVGGGQTLRGCKHGEAEATGARRGGCRGRGDPPSLMPSRGCTRERDSRPRPRTPTAYGGARGGAGDTRLPGAEERRQISLLPCGNLSPTHSELRVPPRPLALRVASAGTKTCTPLLLLVPRTSDALPPLRPARPITLHDPRRSRPQYFL